jgi:(1->4)-alpha-D-glucan 1-alpha-D-glucosylmutase
VSIDRVATYRLQLHSGFGFAEAQEIAGYLDSLGISHLYLSPILTARAGSQHGYDVVDHQRVNPELGGIEGLRALAQSWPGEIVVDIVPNHMAVADPANRWWWDVLKHGPASDYAEYFDIDWDPSEERLKRSILVPILGDHYGRVLEAGEVRVELHDGEPCVRYYEHVFPLAPSSREHDLDAINADKDRLHELLEAQHYRLAYWKVAGRDLNYRRFFAINDLAALRVDRQDVFDQVHKTIFELVDEGLVQGLRVDHIDGLRYPRGYLERLRSRCPNCYVVVEKILEGTEGLHDAWPIAGTTGYEFIKQVDGLFVDPRAEKPLDAVYARFSGSDHPPEAMALEAKFHVMNTELATDIERLTDLFVLVCEDQRRYRDFTRPELRQAQRETLASFRVYRTYVDVRTGDVRPEDERTVIDAIEDAQDRRTDLDPEIFDVLKQVLLLELEGEEEAALAMRFQQASGPVMAKAIEDTFFYRFERLVALNEVGGDPMHLGHTIDDFHLCNRRTQERWPETMLAGSTHDTKRSEDVRARLALLSEIPDEWSAGVMRWAQHNDRHRPGEWPDQEMEYLLYQTLVGAWPLSADRAIAYMDKAAKEAKVHTSWISPNEGHDAALATFVGAVMDDPEFMADIGAFASALVAPGHVNSLSQALLRITSPGVPDFYQGTEVWDFSLVDPDNRRPVDYQARGALLEQVLGADVLDGDRWGKSGMAKMWLIHRALHVRKRHPEAFGPHGTYEPLIATGSRAEHVVAFSRGGTVISIAPRLVLTLAGDWQDTSLELPPGSWRNAFTGVVVTDATLLAPLLQDLPVALLEREE